MICEKKEYGTLADGRTIHEYRLTNSRGHGVSLINYGGIVTSLRVPDRQGILADVVLGFDALSDYVAKSPYFGCIVGRVANRIAAGRFVLDGEARGLAVNSGSHHLHGGLKGFDKQVWAAKAFEERGCVGVTLSRSSPDGEEGYPGTLAVTVTYRWTESSELQIDYQAETDKPTVCNPSHHGWFNLGDGGASPILDHCLQIEADRYTPVDEGLIPTGDLADVRGTPFDFRQETAIGQRIEAQNRQLETARGYDHNYVLRLGREPFRKVATLYHPGSGRQMEVLTTEPGLQVYSSNFLDGSLRGKDGTAYRRRHGLCLETQHFPDSPNKPTFPTTRLDPGQLYLSRTVYRFSVRTGEEDASKKH